MEREPRFSALDDLHVHNNIATNIAQQLWTNRDCSVNVDVGFMIERVADSINVHKNTIRTYFFNSKGEALIKTKFTYKEIKKAADTVLSSYAFERQKNDRSSAFVSEPTSRVKTLLRKNRFYLWVTDARKQDDLLTRVSLYITALEALLSTSNSELAHQLSERVAFFFPKLDGAKRKDYYQWMKKSYAFRSKGLHGDVIKATEVSELRELSIFLDEVCRIFYREAIENEEFCKLLENDEELNRSFNERLFLQ